MVRSFGSRLKVQFTRAGLKISLTLMKVNYISCQHTIRIAYKGESSLGRRAPPLINKRVLELA